MDYLNRLSPHQWNLILAGLLTLAMAYIAILHILLKREKTKRLFPLLSLEVNPKEARIYLKNISATPARDIHLDDIGFVLGYEFQKKLTLKFTPLDILPGEHGTALDYKVFEGTHEFRHSRADNVLAHLAGAAFDTTVHYKNMTGASFAVAVHKSSDSFKLKETHSKKE